MSISVFLKTPILYCVSIYLSGPNNNYKLTNFLNFHANAIKFYFGCHFGNRVTSVRDYRQLKKSQTCNMNCPFTVDTYLYHGN